MNKLFVEKPKNMIINLIISFVVILATVAFAGLSGSDLVIQTAWYILIIHWVAFLPALIFKTEKFYHLYCQLVDFYILFSSQLDLFQAYEIHD